ncbi:hypothetical protein PQ690_08295 [Thermoanaerobacterium thermosaccharolyticum]|uniref:hypothetical protein n=1 Tax=Thermoanaerobacterium thermosaccharolyticum TaxID=1517 RepID=UPI003DA9F9AA
MTIKHKNLWNLIFIGLNALLLVSSISNLLLYLKSVNINNYLSRRVFEDTSGFASSVLKTDQILNDSLHSKQITVGNANILGNEFLNQSNDIFDLVDIYVHNAMEEIPMGNIISYIPEEFSLYISRILNRPPQSFDIYAYNKDEIIKLNKEQLAKFTKMKDINDKLVEIVKKDVKGLKTYGIENNADFTPLNAIKNPLWKRLINDIVDYKNKIHWSPGFILNS